MKYGIPTPEKLPLLDVGFCDDCKERIMKTIAFFFKETGLPGKTK